MRAHQPGSTPIDIPETIPNPVYTPRPAPVSAPERGPTKAPEKVPEKTIAQVSLKRCARGDAVSKRNPVTPEGELGCAQLMYGRLVDLRWD